MASFAEFQTGLNRYRSDRLPKLLTEIMREVLRRLARNVVIRTPVRTGLARGNWRVALGNTVALSTLRRRDPTGEQAIAAAFAVISRAALQSRARLYNNLPYIPRLENGWSRQAPQGMIRLSVQQARVEWAAAIRDARTRLGGRFVVG